MAGNAEFYDESDVPMPPRYKGSDAEFRVNRLTNPQEKGLYLYLPPAEGDDD